MNTWIGIVNARFVGDVQQPVQDPAIRRRKLAQPELLGRLAVPAWIHHAGRGARICPCSPASCSSSLATRRIRPAPGFEWSMHAHHGLTRPIRPATVTKCRDLSSTPDVLYPVSTMVTTRDDQLLRLIRRLGLVRPSEVEAHGIPRARLYRMVQTGRVVRQARGIYVASTHAYTAEHTLAEVAKRVPGGVLCLLTALRYHGLTTQNPAEVWIALPEKARKPRLDYPRLRVARFSGAALTEGIETHRIERVDLRVYSAAKTVADCFKYRNKLGIDIAVEALRDFSRRYRGGANDLARFARVCRVTRVMQPYLDAIA